MITKSQAAQLAYDAYFSPKEFAEKHKDGSSTGIKLIADSGSASSYRLFFVQTVADGKFYIVGKGTNLTSPADLAEDLKLAFNMVLSHLLKSICKPGKLLVQEFTRFAYRFQQMRQNHKICTSHR